MTQIDLNTNLVYVEYVGKSSPISWTAPVSGKTYIFGAGNHSRKYVNPVDVKHFLDIWVENSPQFRVVAPLAQTVAAPAPPLDAHPVGGNAEEVGVWQVESFTEQDAILAPIPDGPPDFTELTVTKLEEALNLGAYTRAELQIHRTREQNGRARITAIALIDELLEATG